MSKYSLEQLKKKLGDPGWRALGENRDLPQEGTLAQMAEAAHARHREGQGAGHLQEIETRIEIDMLQLEELWRQMGLPTV